MSIPPTGEQHEIVSGGHRAVITEVGAGLRSYAVDGVDVVRGFAEDAAVKGGRGQNLIPWPNRIRDGKYTFAGQAHQLALTEPARGNATHGLVRYAPWLLAVVPIVLTGSIPSRLKVGRVYGPGFSLSSPPLASFARAALRPWNQVTMR